MVYMWYCYVAYYAGVVVANILVCVWSAPDIKTWCMIAMRPIIKKVSNHSMVEILKMVLILGRGPPHQKVADAIKQSIKQEFWTHLRHVG